MKKSLSCFIVLLSLSLWSAISNAEDPWCCHRGYPIFNSDVLTTSGSPVSVGNGGQATSASFIAEKMAEAYNRCVAYQKNLTAGALVQCKADSATTGMSIAEVCSTTAILGVVGGAVYATKGAATAALVTAKGIQAASIILAGIASSCNSLGSAGERSRLADCDSKQQAAIDAACSGIK